MAKSEIIKFLVGGLQKTKAIQNIQPPFEYEEP